ncbi:MAG: branched-chain amino acid ABC transporter permease [Variovorax sp.]|nr:branched-chain amino acid ABC transporter permease [Variovorax sp.]
MDQTSMAAQILVSGLLIGCIYALVAWGFTIVYNATGLINFAAGEFVMMGGVISAALNAKLGWPPVVAVPLAIATVAAIAALIDWGCLQRARRQAHLTLVMLTIGLAIVLRGAMLFSAGKDFQFPPAFTEVEIPSVLGINVPAQGVWIFGAVLAVALILWQLFARSWLGWSMRAAGENPRAALLMGISPKQVSTVAFAMAGAMGALAGALIAPLASANYTSGLFFGLKGFSAAILGGIGSPLGAVVGGLLLGVIENVAAGYVSSGWKDAIALGILIIVLLVKPTGIFGGLSVKRV